MSKTKSLRYQVKGRLVKKLAIGVSRHAEKAKTENRTSQLIHSWNTYNTYIKQCVLFAQWVKSNYGIKDVSEMEPYIRLYIEHRIGRDLSAWTIKLDKSAISKLYGYDAGALDIQTPVRRRADIKRSRGDVKGFSEEKHSGLVDFCKATGVRVHELRALKRKDVFLESGVLYVHVEKGKGGKMRDIPVRKELEYAVINALHKSSDIQDKLFESCDIPRTLPCHKYRAMYAKAQYQRIARDTDTIPRSDRYVCKADKAGIVYDKAAMKQVSQMLGHNRIDVIAQSYLY